MDLLHFPGATAEFGWVTAIRDNGAKRLASRRQHYYVTQVEGFCGNSFVILKSCDATKRFSGIYCTRSLLGKRSDAHEIRSVRLGGHFTFVDIFDGRFAAKRRVCAGRNIAWSSPNRHCVTFGGCEGEVISGMGAFNVWGDA